MSKIIFAVVLAIFALQFSDARHLKTKNINEEIDALVSAHDFDTLINNLQKEINLMLEDNEVQRVCGPKIFEIVGSLHSTAQSQIEVCTIKAKYMIANNQESTRNILKKLEDCLAIVEKEVNARTTKVITELEKCIENSLEFDVNSDIDEIVSSHDIENIIQELLKDVNDILKDHEEAQLRCGPKIHELVGILSMDATARREICIIQAKQSISNNPDDSEKYLKELDACLSNIEEKIVSDKLKVISDLYKCIESV